MHALMVFCSLIFFSFLYHKTAKSLAHLYNSRDALKVPAYVSRYGVHSVAVVKQISTFLEGGS